MLPDKTIVFCREEDLLNGRQARGQGRSSDPPGVGYLSWKQGVGGQKVAQIGLVERNLWVSSVSCRGTIAFYASSGIMCAHWEWEFICNMRQFRLRCQKVTHWISTFILCRFQSAILVPTSFSQICHLPRGGSLESCFLFCCPIKQLKDFSQSQKWGRGHNTALQSK